MSKNRASRAWRIYLLLGVLLACGYFVVPPSTTRDLIYDVVAVVAGWSTVAAVLLGVRMYRPARSLPWYLFVIGLLLLVIGITMITFHEVYSGEHLQFPSYVDPLSLAF